MQLMELDISEAARKFTRQPKKQDEQPVQDYPSSEEGVPDFAVVVHGLHNDGFGAIHLSVVRKHKESPKNFVHVVLKVDDENIVTGIGGEGHMKVWVDRPSSKNDVDCLTYHPVGDGSEAVVGSRSVAEEVGLPLRIDWKATVSMYALGEVDGQPLTAEQIFAHPVVALE